MKTISFEQFKKYYKLQQNPFTENENIEVDDNEYLTKLRDWYRYFQIIKPHIVDKSKDDKVNFFGIEETFEKLYETIIRAEQYLKENSL